MRLLRLLLPVMPLLFFLPGTGLCEGKAADRPEGMSRPIPDKVSGTCRTIAAILSVYPSLEVRKSEEPARDSEGATVHPGCRILASGPSSGIAGETDPAEALRDMFQGNGWTEETRYSADGPGTTSFAFRNFGMSCHVHGGAHSWIEGGKPFSSDRYELQAGCVSDPDGAMPDLPHGKDLRGHPLLRNVPAPVRTLFKRRVRIRKGGGRNDCEADRGSGNPFHP